MFGDKAIDKDLPVPGSRIADVLDMKPNVCGAIAEQLVIPLRLLVKLVCGLYVVEEKSSGSFRSRRNQVIEIDGWICLEEGLTSLRSWPE